ncbi:unnamed protein product [Orchesella dallaii]|uniref:Peptidase S1 domain-containing protein n=1 Tax=Orchesella dallaii TaxID=48710 RepID=A0ABP1Q8W3_9HEXA
MLYHQCGVLDEIPGDIRTQAPWTAAIFYRSTPQDDFVYQAAGIIISPTTVLTVFPGVHGKLPKKVKGKYSIQNPANTLIAAGIDDGNLENSDKHSQFTQVTFVEPYMGIEDQDKEYHFALLHLKTPFDLTSSYVRQLCIEEVGPGNAKAQTLNSTITLLLQGGFAKYKIKNEDNQTSWGARLKIQRIEVKSGYDCVQSYEHYYNSDFPMGMFCAQLPESVVSSDNDHSCLLHGSAIVRKNKDNQWYLVGLTALIRGRKGGLCRNDTVYFNARLSYSLEWIRRSLRCSPFSFSCGDGGCTSLEAVCNSVPNCVDESDEEERFCQANNRCEGNTPHQCNLQGDKCIREDAVCDGRSDCEDGSDEVMCHDQAGRKTRDASVSSFQPVCPALLRKEGVHIEYILSDKGIKVTKNVSVVPLNTFAYLKCKNFYKSKYIYNHIENQCVVDGVWSSFSPFECEADCGMPNRIKSNEIPDTESKLDAADLSFPWNALLYVRNETSLDFKILCAATLIEKSSVITSAECVAAEMNHTVPIPVSNLLVVLNPSSELLEENLKDPNSKAFNVKSISYNGGVANNSTIAIVKFDGVLEYNTKIRPVCISTQDIKEELPYHVKKYDNRFRSKMSVAVKGMHVSEYPFVVEVACIRKDFNVISDMKCIGHDRGMSIPLKYLGGALVTQERTKFGTRFMLKGIMRNKEDTIAHFSSVERYIEWILGSFR